MYVVQSVFGLGPESVAAGAQVYIVVFVCGKRGEMGNRYIKPECFGMSLTHAHWIKDWLDSIVVHPSKFLKFKSYVKAS